MRSGRRGHCLSAAIAVSGGWCEEELEAATAKTARFMALYDELESSLDDRIQTAFDWIFQDVWRRAHGAATTSDAVRRSVNMNSFFTVIRCYLRSSYDARIPSIIGAGRWMTLEVHRELTAWFPQCRPSAQQRR
jgi:hypothetical protein